MLRLREDQAELILISSVQRPERRNWQKWGTLAICVSEGVTGILNKNQILRPEAEDESWPVKHFNRIQEQTKGRHCAHCVTAGMLLNLSVPLSMK